jgi:RHS repeat-associated protein
MVAGQGNRLLSDSVATYEYDGEGNLTRRVNRTSGDVISYAYDYRNRLVRVTTSGRVPVDVTYAYDLLDRRILATSSRSTQRWVYEGDNPILRFDGDGALSSRRLYGIGVDEIVAEETRAGIGWFLSDQVGSTRDLVGDGGELIAHAVYDAFGVLLTVSRSTNNDLWFAAREHDGLVGDYYFRARIYVPELGRFQQEDPIQPWGYSYAANNPLRFSDPFGLSETAEYNTVYYAVNSEGEVQYIGITKDFAARAAQHSGRFAIRRINPALNGLSRADARAVEQALIEFFQLGKNGGSLLNKINSIARTNPTYPQAMQRAWQILGSIF